MNQIEVTALFDQQAASYDTQWAKTAPIKNCLHFLLASSFAELPPDARVLCVGVGTGAELSPLAQLYPGWRFTAVEPSGPMLDACRQRATAEGFVSRCDFHEGYLDSLPTHALYDAATCFLVSQFMLDPQTRTDFFRGIARRLKVGGLLASADLAADVASTDFEQLLRAWVHMMSSAGLSPEAIERMRKAYTHDVSVLTPDRVAALIAAGGFERPVPFFQAGLIHAWLCTRAPEAMQR